MSVLDAHGVAHALLMQPNSGYDDDNSYLLDVLASGGDRFRGMAVVPNDVAATELETLKAAGVVGITFNAGLLGTANYADTDKSLATLADLGLMVDLQVQGDQLNDMSSLVDGSEVRIVIDHCGRPTPNGLPQQGFSRLLQLGRDRRAVVKLSSLVKCSAQRYPWADAWPYVEALLEAFGPENCVWASDWPFLRAPERIDYGPLLALVARLIPDPGARREVLWETPRRVFGFPG